VDDVGLLAPKSVQPGNFGQQVSIFGLHLGELHGLLTQWRNLNVETRVGLEFQREPGAQSPKQ
jgi:hypothetical protein